jgi:hypothetical protein
MKRTHLNTTARFTGLVIALALFAGAAGELQAQEKGSARGGAKQLMPPTAPPALSDYTPMSCPKCKEEAVSRVDWTARGANKPTVLVATHLCDGCAVDWSTSGHGRAKVSVATHKCTGCGAESVACCGTKKGGTVATKGMEKKFEVAPVK